MHCAPDPGFTATLTGAPTGRAGAFHTARLMRQLIDASKTDAAMIQKATTIIYMVPQQDQLSEVRELFDFVRDRIRYQRDVLGIETLSTPQMTLLRGVGDCDDKVTLLATLLESVGYPTRIVMGGYASRDFEHVYLQVFALDQWITCDATMFEPLGWEPPNPMIRWIEREGYA